MIRRPRAALSAFVVTAAFAVLAAPVGAVAQTAAPSSASVGAAHLCPANLVTLSGSAGVVVGCWCPAGGSAGAVWGSGPYAVVSDLCGAARHAGAVGAEGGAVWARVTAGLGIYEGSAANGVETQALGSFGASIEILNAGGGDEEVAECPETAQGLAETTRCRCPAERVGIGAVWGTDIYTYDSTLCTAALHAGALTRKGGVVTVTPLAGQDSYAGSTRNGVTTDSYGSWGGSMRFD